MAIKYTIGLDIGGAGISSLVNSYVLPLVSQAVTAIAKQAKVDWQAAVYQAKLWSGEKDAYAQSIEWKSTGPFSAIVEAGYKYADDIETGRPARDLKRMLDTSQKVRRTKDGRRFLVIPLRHNIPTDDGGGMPTAVYGMANVMKASSVTGSGMRPSGQTMLLSPKSGMHPSPQQTPFLSSRSSKAANMVASQSYAWGDRLKKSAMKEAGLDAATRKRYAGMVKMNTSTPGGSTSSAYLTFRIMMEGSSGWIVGPKPGLFLAKKVADALQPKADQVLAEAVKKTLG